MQEDHYFSYKAKLGFSRIKNLRPPWINGCKTLGRKNHPGPDPDNRIYVDFTDDKSFVDYRGRVTEKMPTKLKQELDFKDAISLSISNPNKPNNVRFVLLKNNNLLVLEIPENFTLPGYRFEYLVTEKEERFLSTNYKSYKLFNEKGEILN